MSIQLNTVIHIQVSQTLFHLSLLHFSNIYLVCILIGLYHVFSTLPSSYSQVISWKSLTSVYVYWGLNFPCLHMVHICKVVCNFEGGEFDLWDAHSFSLSVFRCSATVEYCWLRIFCNQIWLCCRSVNLVLLSFTCLSLTNIAKCNKTTAERIVSDSTSFSDLRIVGEIIYSVWKVCTPLGFNLGCLYLHILKFEWASNGSMTVLWQSQHCHLENKLTLFFIKQPD